MINHELPFPEAPPALLLSSVAMVAGLGLLLRGLGTSIAPRPPPKEGVVTFELPSADISRWREKNSRVDHGIGS